MSLRDARLARDAARLRIRGDRNTPGIDIVQEKRTAREEKKAIEAVERAKTFEECAQAYIDENWNTWSGKHRAQWPSSLKRGQDYIAANITGDLTGGLSDVEGSFVIARSSALAIAPQLLAVDEIGRRFGIRFVLRGSAFVGDGRLHVTAALLRTEDGQQVWSMQFERDFVALRRLEREIIDEIAHQLGATIADAASVHLSASVPDAGALDASLRANAVLDMPQTAKTLGEARRLFEAALQADPHAVEAKTGLAAVHLASALSGWGSGLAIELQQCERLVQQVLTTEPRHPHALSILGALRRATNRRREALAAYEAVLAADRNNANAHAQIGRLKIDLGEAASALPHIELALRLSPLDAQRSLWFTFAGLALLNTGQPKVAGASDGPGQAWGGDGQGRRTGESFVLGGNPPAKS